MQFYSEPKQFLNDMNLFYPWVKEVEAFCISQTTQFGFCEVCEAASRFSVLPALNNGWRDMRGGYVCSGCNLSARLRLLFEVVDKYAGFEGRGLIFERVTPFYSRINKHFSQIDGVEYLSPDEPSGTIVLHNDMAVTHQDMMNTSYDDNCFDCVIHSDVLEHVPDYIAALKENFRILKPGGKLVFACPVYNYMEHKQRARVDTSGEIEHLCEPSFHGNPLGGGALVFWLYGYNLVDDLSSLGFESPGFYFAWDLIKGYLSNTNSWYDIGHMWPVVFVAEKPKNAA